MGAGPEPGSGVRLASDRRTVLLSLENAFYPPAAVLAAAGVFGSRAEVRVDGVGSSSRVRLRAPLRLPASELRVLALEFLNEALNQSVREACSAADRAGPMVYARAMLSALGEGRPPAALDGPARAQAEALLREARALWKERP